MALDWGCLKLLGVVDYGGHGGVDRRVALDWGNAIKTLPWELGTLIWLCLLIVGTVRNMKRNTKEGRGSTSDIISNLLENIKATVLVCLPIQDAVRTSVLSTKWRYIWTKLPQLVFDDNFCRESARKSKTELMMTIYQVLTSSWTNTQEFTLPIQKGEPYKLMSSLFSCEQLRYLSLHSCVFKSPPEFKGFSRLVELVLYRVFVASNTLSSLISSCPLLEKLSLKRSFSSDCLEINAPNLRFLVCEIYGSSICLKNTARLAWVSICFMGIFNVEGITEAETSKLVTLFGSLPVIEFLLLEYHTIRYMSAGGVPKRLPTTLNNLKTLKLLSICFAEVNEISVILCLIRSSPNLEKITIVVRRCETADVIDHVLQLLEMQD
ncbi:F-box/FBD/LRR-repeat protein At1g13570-like [Camellia sinensis]|uniref:F-box/FBD/LRR-repeat protein At1g13570-like n=1 Tax=Camellia sinensis TaxID=4442 RepID=UPI0010355116|nr:F-box/FBD/LRR-repeat protein At1g13570-like [Camellia sinensis]